MMDYLLFEIDDINYALPVDAVDHIEDIPPDKRPRAQKWQGGLLKTGKREKGKRYNKIISVSPGENLGLIRVLIDSIKDIRDVLEVEPYPFPAESSEVSGELLESILMLDDIPYLVLAGESIQRFIGSDG